ncbi:MAG: hypothetical protein H5T69_02970, partial [Chloroflexi bacterium]|nr:hypothetical protein [Chloroflexota bacterium]
MKTNKWYLGIAGALILALAVLVGSATFQKGGTAEAALATAQLKAIPGPAMPPLTEAPCVLVGSTRTCELWAKVGAVTMPDAAVVPVWGFAVGAAEPALVPGPIL